MPIFFPHEFLSNNFTACYLKRKYLACREKWKSELRCIRKKSAILGNMDMFTCMWG